MARYLIQSQATGMFLVPNPIDGQPEWVRNLQESGGGVIDSIERVTQLCADWMDFDEIPIIVDLDRLGTPADYI